MSSWPNVAWQISWRTQYCGDFLHAHSLLNPVEISLVDPAWCVCQKGHAWADNDSDEQGGAEPESAAAGGEMRG